MASALFVWLLGFGGRPIRGATVGIFSPICVLWIVTLAVVIHWAGGAVTTAWMADSLKPFISTGSSLTVILPKRVTKFEKYENQTRYRRWWTMHPHVHSIFRFVFILLSIFFWILLTRVFVLTTVYLILQIDLSRFSFPFPSTRNHLESPTAVTAHINRGQKETNPRIRVNWIFSFRSWHLWQLERTCSFEMLEKLIAFAPVVCDLPRSHWIAKRIHAVNEWKLLDTLTHAFPCTREFPLVF